MSYKSLKSLTPAQALVLYYGVAILAGALLLCTPLAAVGPHLSFLDALFTATSAQCVTGLSVVDTGTRLSGFGQGVVLALIQVGGLGITTFSVYLFIYLRVGVSIRGRWIINETLLPTPVSSWRDLIRSIFLTTLIIETLGTLLLAFVFVPDLGLKQGLYSAVFHSISAFCNAGFSLFPDSLIGYRNNPLVNVTIMALIILGGIGFLVIRELVEACKPRQNPLQPRRFSLHTKLVILTTLFLIIYGAVTIGWLERHDALAHMTTGEATWTALFQSVSARTAGFNTIDLDLFRVPTLFLMIFLMFIGASPGSAGGGVKTTCLALLFILFYNRLKGNPNTNAFGRTIPEEVISRALSLFLLAIIVIGLALFGLLIAQSPDWAHENPREFLGFMFETVSAFGTVGLSMGSTGQLNVASKCIVIALMFIGRVGLLTMAFAIARRTRSTAPRYAEENIMIG